MTGERPLKLTIAALGGQGGGVLADWLIATADAEGYLVQSTSVPGVAQRTGATIYYLEFFPRASAERAGRAPVMALMPVPGDVDCVIASELAEAGRAIQRGIVTRDRTTMGQTIERGNSCLYQPMTWLVIQVGNQAEPATVAFVGVFVESLGGSAHLCGLEF